MKYNLSQSYSNKIFKKYFPNMIRDHKEEYALYFVTFVFENQLAHVYPDSILEYFKAFYQKLNQQIVNNPSKNKHKKAKMILVPEKSYHCTNPKLNGLDHYHGIIMIRKDLKDKFEYKCCLNQQWIEYYNIEKDDSLRVKAFMLHSLLLHQKRKRIGLTVYSVDARCISENDPDIFRVCSYMTKNIGHYSDNQCDFDLTDIRKLDGGKSITVLDKKRDKDFFDESDVLIFTDISTLNVKKYVPKRISKVKKTAYDTRDESSLSEFGALMKKINNDFLDRFYNKHQ